MWTFIGCAQEQKKRTPISASVRGESCLLDQFMTNLGPALFLCAKTDTPSSDQTWQQKISQSWMLFQVKPPFTADDPIFPMVFHLRFP